MMKGVEFKLIGCENLGGDIICTEPKIARIFKIINGEEFDIDFSWTFEEYALFEMFLYEYFNSK